MTFTFNQQVLVSSITAGEFYLENVVSGDVETATSFTIDGPQTVTWYFDPSIFSSTPSNGGLAEVLVYFDNFGAGPNIPTDLSGTPLTQGGTEGYFTYFYYDNEPPTIVSSSIDGMVFSPAPATVTETVDFSETMNTRTSTSACTATISGATYSPALEVWQTGPNGPNSELVLTYSNLPDDTYSLNLYAGGFYDLVGNALQNTYTANFAVAFGSGAFATLTPVNPLGSLIYEGNASQVLVMDLITTCSRST